MGGCYPLRCRFESYSASQNHFEYVRVRNFHPKRTFTSLRSSKVERCPEEACVGGSSPSEGTIFRNQIMNVTLANGRKLKLTFVHSSPDFKTRADAGEFR